MQKLPLLAILFKQKKHPAKKQGVFFTSSFAPILRR
nr:MAG TPA: hypothetical protein [Caudoviricetes sp.]